MIPLKELRTIGQNEEKLQQIVLYIQQLEPLAQKTTELSQQLKILENSTRNINDWINVACQN